MAILLRLWLHILVALYVLREKKSVFDWKVGEAMSRRESVKYRIAEIIGWTARILGSLFLLVSVALLLVLVFFIALRKFSSLRDGVRQFNKRILNPAVLNFAGRRYRYYAVVRHIGRRSGYVYSTPVVAIPIVNGFVVSLPYGDEVDWCRNVLATGRCTIQWNGYGYVVGEPELIDATATLPGITPLGWFTLRILGGEHLLKVKQLAEVPAALA
jgi:hypothetical protein